MKYQDEYRDPHLVQELAGILSRVCKSPMRFMELCGTHTYAVARHGLRTLMPPHLELISGPGCPVCVTTQREIDQIIKLAQEPGVVLATFGDMLKVPGSQGSLALTKARGAQVEVVYSPLDALSLAVSRPDKQIVFVGIGFETTAPTTAAALIMAQAQRVDNFRLFCLHKLMPPVLYALLPDPDLDGFLCPGHVTTVIGLEPYKAIACEFKMPCVAAGFEPADILSALIMLAEQVKDNMPKVELQYGRGVKQEGNLKAREIMERVFEVTDTSWRGLGLIAKSGLAIKEQWACFDAGRCFDLQVPQTPEPAGCACGEILRGRRPPQSCPLFAGKCTPLDPVGPCMVSQEGACAAQYNYGQQ